MKRLKQAEDINNANEDTIDNTNNSIDNSNNSIDNAIDLLERINNSVDNIKDAYYLLLDNLNAINSSYPNLYKELEQLIKLPGEEDIKEVVTLKNDVDEAIKYLEDPEFLKGVMKNTQ